MLGSYSSTAKSIYTICLHIHHVFVDNFHGKQSSSIHPCWSVVNHAHEHINILEYTENFCVYTDLENKGSTNAGENVRYMYIFTCVHMRVVVTVNVRLAQARPSYTKATWFAHSVYLQQIGGFDKHIQWGSYSHKEVHVLVISLVQIHILLLTSANIAKRNISISQIFFSYRFVALSCLYRMLCGKL